MAKERMKRALGAKAGKERLSDTDRLTPKAEGGQYVDGNVVLSEPVSHMERHGNLRLRPEHLEELKAIIDDREQVMKLFYKFNNQMLAYERRTDRLNEATLAFLKQEIEGVQKELKGRDRLLTQWVNKHKREDALMISALGVLGVGTVTIAYLTAYIDLEKAQHASSLWAYVGYDKSSHERYTKGVKGGGNKTLRTVLYNTECSMMKGSGPYREVYDRRKNRLALSEKITKSRNTQGKLIECAWKDTKPGHRHGAALREVGKCFLADYWFVGRSILGLPTDALYVQDVLGHGGTIDPKARGWEW